jgi:hypothetical protein
VPGVVGFPKAFQGFRPRHTGSSGLELASILRPSVRRARQSAALRAPRLHRAWNPLRPTARERAPDLEHLRPSPPDLASPRTPFGQNAAIGGARSQCCRRGLSSGNRSGSLASRPTGRDPCQSDVAFRANRVPWAPTGSRPFTAVNWRAVQVPAGESMRL